MKITILQDHTDFMERMILCAYDHHHGLPLSAGALNQIRVKTVVGKHKGRLYTLGALTEAAEQAPPAEQRKLAKTMAAAVEADMEGWYCVQDDEGAQWLREHYVGPVLDWNGAVWWGKLKGLEIEAEVVFHECFKQRKSGEPGRTAGRQRDEVARVPGSPSLFRPDVEAIE